MFQRSLIIQRTPLARIEQLKTPDSLNQELQALHYVITQRIQDLHYQALRLQGKRTDLRYLQGMRNAWYRIFHRGSKEKIQKLMGYAAMLAALDLRLIALTRGEVEAKSVNLSTQIGDTKAQPDHERKLSATASRTAASGRSSLQSSEPSRADSEDSKTEAEAEPLTDDFTPKNLMSLFARMLEKSKDTIIVADQSIDVTSQKLTDLRSEYNTIMQLSFFELARRRYGWLHNLGSRLGPIGMGAACGIPIGPVGIAVGAGIGLVLTFFGPFQQLFPLWWSSSTRGDNTVESPARGLKDELFKESTTTNNQLTHENKQLVKTSYAAVAGYLWDTSPVVYVELTEAEKQKEQAGCWPFGRSAPADAKVQPEPVQNAEEKASADAAAEADPEIPESVAGVVKKATDKKQERVVFLDRAGEFKRLEKEEADYLVKLGIMKKVTRQNGYQTLVAPKIKRPGAAGA